ncbi:TPA: hypothetical protein EYP13_01880 [Candidatus Micrarchaeota archaeon]|nr:hypothetical protein [Candidatus Micrarchaeota archaeon]
MPVLKKIGKYLKEKTVQKARMGMGLAAERASSATLLMGKIKREVPKLARVGANIAKRASETAYEKTAIQLSRMGRKAKWEKDAAEIAVRMKVDRLTVMRLLNHMSREMPLSEARERLRALSQMKVDREAARTVAQLLLKDVRSGVDPRIAHGAAMKAMEIVRKNPELAKKLAELYVRHRNKLFLEFAEPPV